MIAVSHRVRYAGSGAQGGAVMASIRTENLRRDVLRLMGEMNGTDQPELILDALLASAIADGAPTRTVNLIAS